MAHLEEEVEKVVNAVGVGIVVVDGGGGGAFVVVVTDDAFGVS